MIYYQPKYTSSLNLRRKGLLDHLKHNQIQLNKDENIHQLRQREEGDSDDANTQRNMIEFRKSIDMRDTAYLNFIIKSKSNLLQSFLYNIQIMK